MSIEFDCPSCHLRYSVKDELAGKGAKCGKCGHRMQIPRLATPAGVDAPARSSKSATAPSAGSPRPVKTAAPIPSAVKEEADSGDVGTWLDDELEVEAPPPPKRVETAGAKCPACGAAITPGAVLCIGCGYDTRTKSKVETVRVADSTDTGKGSKKPSKLGTAASLLRGTLFSFIGAMLGALLWAGIAYATSYELGYIAWALGGLAGFGMALGHDDDDGTIAGIIAAFMSLVGIVAAKILVVVFVVASLFANVAGEIDAVGFNRQILASAMAGQRLRAAGVDLEKATEEQWEQANAEAAAEIAHLNEQQIDERMEALSAQAEAEAKLQQPGGLVSDEPGNEKIGPINVTADDEAAEDDDMDVGPGNVASFFSLMFSPMDGIFILLAFFTAYKVGSGTMSD